MSSLNAAEQDRVMNKVLWRLVPFMMLLYWFNYLDRTNISVAKLKMNGDLNFDDASFATGTAMFYVGYFIFELPSNILLERFGARVWIARIMISWGLVSVAFMFAQGEISYYSLRILLGITEAGYFPGMLLFLTYWFPARQRAKVGAIFMTSIPLACALGQPLSGYVMDHFNGVAGLKGWQWLFLLGGSLTVLLGCSVYFYMTDKPATAKWLKPEEREWLTQHIASEHAVTQSSHGMHNLIDAMKSPRVWLLSVIYVALMFGFYGIIYWTPTITKEVYTAEFGAITDQYASVLSAIPYAWAALGMVVIGALSDRIGNRRGIVIVGMLVGSISLYAASQTQSTIWTLVSLSFAAVGIIGSLSPFWTLPPAFLTGTAVAAGFAFINSWGNLGGGYASLEAMGQLKKHFSADPHAYKYGLMADAGMLLIGAVLVCFVRVGPPKAEPASRSVAIAVE